MALRGTNQEFGRPYNRRIVLEAIRLHGPLTRADIARRVGLTPQTVANIVREIEVHGFILSRREAPKGRGLPASALALNPDGGFAVGVHVTPRGLEAALVNIAGTIVARARRDLPRSIPTPPSGRSARSCLRSRRTGRTAACWGSGSPCRARSMSSQ
jgi:hypothetical protein